MSSDLRKVLTALVVAAFVLVALPVAAEPPDGKGPPDGEESGNNLSFPAIETENVAPLVFYWDVPKRNDDLLLGTHYSYGCAIPETVDQFSYPNTSCCLNCAGDVEDAQFLDEAACAAGPCAGYEVYPIYWQKVPDNQWNAATLMLTAPVQAHYVDWSDNLESNTWTTRSVVRVETQPYSDVLLLAPPDLPSPFEGLQMWHVSGHGISEHWGVRAYWNSDIPYDVDPLPFVYDSPYAIIHSDNARLNLTKLETGDADCPSPGSGISGTPPDLPLVWDPVGHHWTGADVCELRDINYSVELNVGGKYVYGYNWKPKQDVMCDTFVKAGWWRLTFYDTTNVNLLVPGELGPPPGQPSCARGTDHCDQPAAETESESETDESLYTPVWDNANNLSYIDICLVAKTQGGGKK